jgi:hypothetical protein
VEIPRWVRLMNDGSLVGLPSLSRRQAYKAEACAMVGGIIALVASFHVPPTLASILVHPNLMASLLRVAGSFALACGYLQSVSNRVTEAYKAWPATEYSLVRWRPARTLRGTIIGYAFILGVVIAFFAVVFWVAH